MKRKDIGWCDSYLYRIQNIELHWTLVVVVMNIMLPNKTHKFLTDGNNVGFPRTTPLHNFRFVWV